MRKAFIYFIILFLFQNVIFSQETMLWRDVDIQKFGKETIYKDLKGDKLKGTFKIAEHDGSYSEISFTDGIIFNMRINYDSNGNLLSEVNYKNGLKEGGFTTYFEDKSIEQKGTFSAGKKTGEWITYNNEGEKIAKENYKNDLKHGIFWKKSNYRRNTEKIIISQEEYQNDIPKGTWFSKIEGENLLFEKKYTAPKTYTLKAYHTNGNLKYVQNYKEGKKDGYWFEKNDEGILKWEKTYLSEGDYTEKRFYDDGTLRSKKTYKDRRVDGEYVQYNKEGEKTKVEFFKNNKRHGKWFRQYSGGTIYLEEYNLGEPSGNWVEKDKDGNVTYEKSYKSPKSYAYKRYHITGKLKESGTYEDGKLEGDYFKYNVNEMVLVKRFYEKGNPINLESYFENGNKREIIKRIGKSDNATVEIYNSDGVLIKSGNFFKKYKNGLWKFFDSKKGRLLEEITYENNYKHGLYRKYNAANTPSIEGNYANNDKDGIWKHYSLAGDVTQEILYKLGKKISTKTFN